MAKTRVKLSIRGFNQLRKSPEMVAGLQEIASGIAQRAGDGYGTDTKKFPSRTIASVYTATPEAMRACAKDGGGTLLRALQS